MGKLVGSNNEKFSDYLNFLNNITLEQRLILAIEEMSKLKKEYPKLLGAR